MGPENEPTRRNLTLINYVLFNYRVDFYVLQCDFLSPTHYYVCEIPPCCFANCVMQLFALMNSTSLHFVGYFGVYLYALLVNFHCIATDFIFLPCIYLNWNCWVVYHTYVEFIGFKSNCTNLRSTHSIWEFTLLHIMTNLFNHSYSDGWEVAFFFVF